MPIDAYLDLLIKEQNNAIALFDYMDEPEIVFLLQHPLVMICSDGWVLPKKGTMVSPPPYQPCSYGEFPGVLERYVREKGWLRLEEAIHKMTAFPASRVLRQDN